MKLSIFTILTLVMSISLLPKALSADCPNCVVIMCGYNNSRDLYQWFNGKGQLDLWNNTHKERFVQLPIRYCRKKIGDPQENNTF
ncbi:CLUMA_CG019028, isoform A [Clunio marinus]|uniref:CLUMA_CG019028, isoform A n=1 Tax=Clunio marinus TaxID=568069 RepID=A0A1J1J087_9DIPT|nr:CLUMA_CG019028, isoform A [Clunio marinus]